MTMHYVSPGAIVWSEGPQQRRAHCPVCGDDGPHSAVLSVRSMAPPHPLLTFLRCPACGSGHYDPPGVTDFADLGQNRDDFWRFYVEVGGGIWETLGPVLAENPAGGTFLDVGCGFGFAVDAWTRLGLGESVGVELADYGRMGARLLGITIYDRLLDECAALAGRRFDVVYASEVIEHVPDPRAFVENLSRYVADDGLLVLTTPAMAYIRREEHSPTLHAALAPGFHGFLLSERAFADAARQCGFTHVDVRIMGERQILWASRRPLALDLASPAAFDRYLDYLVGRVRDGDPASPVWQGFAYRLAKEWSNRGEHAKARELADRLLQAASAAVGHPLADPADVLSRLKACASLVDVGAQMPYFLPNLYFHLANLALARGEGTRAQRLYEGSIACTLEVARLGSVFFLEAISLVWPARAMLAELAAARGNAAEAAAAYAWIAAEGDVGAAANGWARAGRDLLETRVPECAEALRRRGALDLARAVHGGYVTHVRRRYGTAMDTAAGVDAALAADASVPLDPLFAPWFAAMLDCGSSAPGQQLESSLAAAREVERVAQRWADHPQFGARMRERAAALATVITPPQVVFSMSTSFKL